MNYQVFTKQLQSSIEEERRIIDSPENQKILANYSELGLLKTKKEELEGHCQLLFSQEKMVVGQIKESPNKEEKSNLRMENNQIFIKRMRIFEEKTVVSKRIGFLLGEIKEIQKTHKVSMKINNQRAIQKKIKKILETRFGVEF